jgi:hemerythrin-like domain-containing protein
MMHSCLLVIREEHAAVAAVLHSLQLMVRQGPGDAPDRFFDVLRAMLFYIDEFPEKLHHPSESDLLFPKLARACPELMPVIRQLESDHMQGEGKVRELQHLLLAWELVGETRRAEFEEAALRYVQFYLDHMRTEEQRLLPVAQAALNEEEWAELDRAFLRGRDLLTAQVPDPLYDRLYARILTAVPAPLGLGASLRAGEAQSSATSSW